jgi:hypothetical protein
VRPALVAFCGLAAAFVLALGGQFACAKAPKRGRSVLLGAENRVLLILPLNVATVMPRELAYVSPIIWSELETYLRVDDRKLKTISAQSAHSLWLESIKQVRAGPQGARAGFDDAARVLAIELRKQTEFDAMIAPSLYVREAPIANRSASWDGVEREIDFETRGLEARSFVSIPLEGSAPAASLHVAVFDANGDKILDAKGGLELVARVRVSKDATTGQPTFTFEARDDLFQDRAQLREGIALAFSPLLAPPPE